MRKKIIYGVCMLGLVALVATSCKKNEENANSFTASFGTLQEDGDDRAYINPSTNLTCWEATDEIKVFNCENGNTAVFVTNESGGNIAQFNNTGGSLGYASKYYSFYPAKMAEGEFEDGYQTFKWDNLQTIYWKNEDTYHVWRTAIPQAACAENQPNMMFKHKIIFGVAKFSLRCEEGENGVQRVVEKIVVRDNRFNLHGTVTLKPDKIDTQRLDQMMEYLREGGVNDTRYVQEWNSYVIGELGYSAKDAGKDMEVSYYEVIGHGPQGEIHGIKLGTTNPKHFYVGLRPGAFAYGGVIEVWVRDGDLLKKIVLRDWESEKLDRAIRPGKIKNLTKGYPNEQTLDITNLVNAWQPGDND